MGRVTASRAAGLVVGVATVLALSTVSAAEDWYPSKWGKDDTLGAVNEISPELIVKAAKLVKTGKRYALGQVTSRETPAFGARTFELFVIGGDGSNGLIGDNEFGYFDDWVLAYMGVGSQIDGLGHASIGRRFYNGHTSDDFFHAGGLEPFGIDDIPPIVTRGVVLDIVGYLKEKGSPAVMQKGGVDMLRGGTAINRAEIEGAAARQGVTLGKGDVVLLHTGYMKMADLDKAAYMKTVPGLGVDGAVYLASKNPVAVGCDTFATEVLPGEQKGIAFPVHQELITKRGIYILENMVTEELVKDQAWEFLFVLGQARLKGAVQMIINPVAIR